MNGIGTALERTLEIAGSWVEYGFREAGLPPDLLGSLIVIGLAWLLVGHCVAGVLRRV